MYVCVCVCVCVCVYVLISRGYYGTMVKLYHHDCTPSDHALHRIL